MAATPASIAGGSSRAWVVLLAVAFAVACGEGSRGDAAHGGQTRGSDDVGGQVISTVHGFAITVAEVQALARESGMSPEQALARLQAERLLMAEAERRGFASDPAVHEVARKAAVQALLEQVANSEPITEAEVQEAYAKGGARFAWPERRATVHVLASPTNKTSPADDAAAKAYATEVIAQLAAAPDPVAFAKALKAQKMAGFTVSGEALPMFDREAGLAQEYLVAMFSLRQAGTVAEPVRTSFGWHAIRVTQITPAGNISYAEAAPQLRAELTVVRQRKLVDEWVERVRKAQGAKPTDSAAKALATLPP